MYAPPLLNAKVNPNAFPDGAFVNDIVAFPFKVLVKLLAVDKSIVNESPVPKLLKFSLKIVPSI